MGVCDGEKAPRRDASMPIDLEVDTPVDQEVDPPGRGALSGGAASTPTGVSIWTAVYPTTKFTRDGGRAMTFRMVASPMLADTLSVCASATSASSVMSCAT